MAVLSIFKVEGDPDEPFAIQQEKIMPIAQEAGLRQSDYRQYEILRHETL